MTFKQTEYVLENALDSIFVRARVVGDAANIKLGTNCFWDNDWSEFQELDLDKTAITELISFLIELRDDINECS